MAITLHPSGSRGAGGYLAALSNGDTAIIDKVAEGWRLAIKKRAQAEAIDRGLFGEAHDIVTLLQAEYEPATVESNAAPRGVAWPFRRSGEH